MHISEAELILFLEGKLSHDGRKQVEQHLAECERCSADLAAISRLDGVFRDPSAPKVDAEFLAQAERLGQKGTTRFFAFRGAARYAVAASIVLAIGLAAMYFLRKAEKVSEYRRPLETPDVFKLLPEDGSTISAARFQWSRVPYALVYDVSLLQEDGRVMWTATTKDTTLTVPSNIVLQQGKRYLWKVEAFFPDETKLGSKLHAFTYSP